MQFWYLSLILIWGDFLSYEFWGEVEPRCGKSQLLIFPASLAARERTYDLSDTNQIYLYWLGMGASDTEWQKPQRLFEHSSHRPGRSSSRWNLAEAPTDQFYHTVSGVVPGCAAWILLGSAVFLASIVTSYSFNESFHYVNQINSVSVSWNEEFIWREAAKIGSQGPCLRSLHAMLKVWLILEGMATDRRC